MLWELVERMREALARWHYFILKQQHGQRGRLCTSLCVSLKQIFGTHCSAFQGEWELFVQRNAEENFARPEGVAGRQDLFGDPLLVGLVFNVCLPDFGRFSTFVCLILPFFFLLAVLEQ